MNQQFIRSFIVSSIDFEKNYRVRDLRIQNGWSDRDLSFLLGYHPLFVRDIENPLKKKSYKGKDINYLMAIFQCESSAIFYRQPDDLTYSISVTAIGHQDKTRTYNIFKILPAGEKQLFKSFTEEPFSSNLTPFPQLKEFLLSLHDSGFFSAPRTGLEIYQKSLRQFGDSIKPTQIHQEIKNINRYKEQIFKTEKNEMRRWVYWDARSSS